MSTLVGMRLSGRYRLDAQIGSGGMSTVYRAFDPTLERQVAIKLHAPRDRRRTPTSSSASAARRAPSPSSRTRTSSA